MKFYLFCVKIRSEIWLLWGNPQFPKTQADPNLHERMDQLIDKLSSPSSLLLTLFSTSSLCLSSQEWQPRQEEGHHEPLSLPLSLLSSSLPTIGLNREHLSPSPTISSLPFSLKSPYQYWELVQVHPANSIAGVEEPRLEAATAATLDCPDEMRSPAKSQELMLPSMFFPKSMPQQLSNITDSCDQRSRRTSRSLK